MHVTAIITGHREKLLCGPSIKSCLEAAEFARSAGMEVEALAVLDRPDDLTSSIFAQNGFGDDLIIGDFGDPSTARNVGVERASGEYVAFLDADDLWSRNWIVAGVTFCRAQTLQTVAHSELNVFFGGEQTIWAHADSEAEDFDAGHLGVGNYWDSLCLASRDILRRFPYTATDLAAGYGYEDWHWNNVTLINGIAHRPVPGTIHFKRRRINSLLSACAVNDVVPWPSDIAVYENAAALDQRRLP